MNSDTPRTDEIMQRIAFQSMAYQCGALEEHARSLERERAMLINALRSIAKPALGGKQQQYTAQAILREMDE
jgi:hypothetical protein